MQSDADSDPVIAVDVLVAAVRAVVWIGGWSMLLALPIAWLRVRRKQAWTGRPREGRDFDLIALGDLVLRPVWIAVLVAWLTLTVIAIAGLELSSQELFALVWGPPTIFVPLAVLRLDVGRLSRVVAEMEVHSTLGQGESGEPAD